MSFEVDGLPPATILRPRTMEELASQVSGLSSEGKAGVPWGGGTRMHVGNRPSDYDVAIDLTGLPVSIEHVAGDMICIASGSATVAAVGRELAKSGQRLPFDVPLDGNATVGGSLASNPPGRMRSSFGGIRDWVIGMKVMSPDGTITKSGGRVVKNVQGFDLHRLQIGAMGTLGIILEAGFKLIPIAPADVTVAAWFDDLATTCQYAMSLFNGPFAPEALTFATGNTASELVGELATDMNQQQAPYLVLMKGAGINTAVERMASEATGRAGSSGAVGYRTLEASPASNAWRALSSPAKPPMVEVRASMRPTAAFEVVDRLERFAETRDGVSFSAVVDIGFGGVQLGMDAPEHAGIRACLDAVAQSMERAGAGYVVERLPITLKSEFDVFSVGGANMEVMTRLKQQFDPGRTFNRGRFAGGI